MDVTFGGSLLSGGRYYRNFTVYLNDNEYMKIHIFELRKKQ